MSDISPPVSTNASTKKRLSLDSATRTFNGRPAEQVELDRAGSSKRSSTQPLNGSIIKDLTRPHGQPKSSNHETSITSPSKLSPPSPSHPHHRRRSINHSSLEINGTKQPLPKRDGFLDRKDRRDGGESRKSRLRTGRNQPIIPKRRSERESGSDRRRRAVPSALQSRVRASLSSASLLSVLSTLTGTTGSSSGSNSTMTPTSYARSHDPGQKHPLRHPRKVDNSDGLGRLHDTVSHGKTEVIDVFNYLETDSAVSVGEGGWESDSSSSSSASCSSSDDQTMSDAGSSHTAATSVGRSPSSSPVLTKTLHRSLVWADQELLPSDPSISTRGSSTESAGGRSASYRQPSVEDGVEDEAVQQAPEIVVTTAPPAKAASSKVQPSLMRRIVKRQKDPSSPRVPSSEAARTVPSTLFNATYFNHRPPRPSANDRPNVTSSGYASIAAKLCAYRSGDAEDKLSLSPVYRRFEALNHRVLLFLQDELSELEEELEILDERIAYFSRNASGSCAPASRRGEVRNGSELHFRRTELLGRIFMKLHQYNDALSSYRETLRGLQGARSEEAEEYRRWLRETRPVVECETRFLDHETDLISLAGRSRQAKWHSNTISLCWTVLGPVAAMVIIHVAYSGGAPNLFIRLLLLASALGAAYPGVEAVISGRSR